MSRDGALVLSDYAEQFRRSSSTAGSELIITLTAHTNCQLRGFRPPNTVAECKPPCDQQAARRHPVKTRHAHTSPDWVKKKGSPSSAAGPPASQYGADGPDHAQGTRHMGEIPWKYDPLLEI